MNKLTADPLDILLKHDAWGTSLLLQRCGPLTHEQFNRRFEMGLGTLHLTFTHIISAMRRWTDRLAQRPLRAPLHAIAERPELMCDAADRSVVQLTSLHNEAVADLNNVVQQCRGHLDAIVQIDWPGADGVKRYTFTRAAVLVHVCTHGMHHRAQALNMIRHLHVPGVSDRIPDTGAVDWQAEIEAPPT